MVTDIENEGPGECPALLCIMDQGKTNQFGKIQSGTAMRHKNAGLCPIGAVAMLLFFCFQVENEPFPDFRMRKNWYNIYLFHTGDRESMMTPEAHRDAQKKAFRKCGLFMNDVVHKPRKVGANNMAMAGMNRS
jgi:hypothetical protein